MTTMIERVARAIDAEGPVGCCAIGDDKARELARAAIEAMRDIDPHIAALVSVNWTLSPEQVGRLFRQAIDVALSERQP